MALVPLATKGNYFHVYDFRVKPGRGDDFQHLVDPYDPKVWVPVVGYRKYEGTPPPPQRQDSRRARGILVRRIVPPPGKHPLRALPSPIVRSLRIAAGKNACDLGSGEARDHGDSRHVGSHELGSGCSTLVPGRTDIGNLHERHQITDANAGLKQPFHQWFKEP